MISGVPSKGIKLSDVLLSLQRPSASWRRWPTTPTTSWNKGWGLIPQSESLQVHLHASLTFSVVPLCCLGQLPEADAHSVQPQWAPWDRAAGQGELHRSTTTQQTTGVVWYDDVIWWNTLDPPPGLVLVSCRCFWSRARSWNSPERSCSHGCSSWWATEIQFASPLLLIAVSLSGRDLICRWLLMPLTSPSSSISSLCVAV